MKLISKLNIGACCDIRMSSEHIFLKTYDRTHKFWSLISLKETRLVKTLRGISIKSPENLKHVLYSNRSKMMESEKEEAVGICCEKVDWIMKRIVVHYRGFKGCVRAVNILPDSDPFDFVLMS
jgi:hypothetical protein